MTQASRRHAGRRVLITGSSRGIGLHLAYAFAAEGATVVINARSASAVDAACAALDERSVRGTIVGAPFDVTDEAEVADAVASIESAVGPLDALINNAGIQRRAPLLELDLADWRAVIDTNLTGAFLVSRAVVPAMIENGRGAIVNICSVQTAISRATTAPYAASKAGLAGLTRTMCAEWAPAGIRVNGLAPGYIDSDMNTALVADEDFSAWVAARTPARRWGDVGDLAGPALWLCSDEAGFVNGQIVYADGGMTAVI